MVEIQKQAMIQLEQEKAAAAAQAKDAEMKQRMAAAAQDAKIHATADKVAKKGLELVTANGAGSKTNTNGVPT